MKNYIVLLLASAIFFTAKAQTLQIVPGAGIQFSGLSYISKRNSRPSDFRHSIPLAAVSMVGDIKYKIGKLTQVISIQNIEVGPSFSFRNIYLDKGIVPTISGHFAASSLGHALLSYGVESQTRLNKTILFNYGIQAGLGFPRGYEYYDSASTETFGMQLGDSYYQYRLQYFRSGLGIFLSAKMGIAFYNRRKKCWLDLEAFWHQGLRQMEEYAISYQYGYYSYPQYQRDQQVILKTRGTVFGVTASVPITILK